MYLTNSSFEVPLILIGTHERKKQTNKNMKEWIF